MPSIWRITLTSSFYNHLDVTNAAGILSEVIPGQCWSRDFKLLRPNLRVPHALSQHTSRCIEALDKHVPIVKICRFPTAVEVAQIFRIAMKGQDGLPLHPHALLLHHQLMLLSFHLGLMRGHRLLIWRTGRLALRALGPLGVLVMWAGLALLLPWLLALRQLLRLRVRRALGLLRSSLSLRRLSRRRLGSLRGLRCTALRRTVLGLRGGNLGFVHVRRLRRGALRSMLARLPVVRLLLSLMCLRLLKSKELLLLLHVLWLAVGHLLLKVHEVDRAHSGVIRLYRSKLSSIQPLSTVW